jgi:hypothetical protein
MKWSFGIFLILNQFQLGSTFAMQKSDENPKNISVKLSGDTMTKEERICSNSKLLKKILLYGWDHIGIGTCPKLMHRYFFPYDSIDSGCPDYYPSSITHLIPFCELLLSKLYLSGEERNNFSCAVSFLKKCIKGRQVTCRLEASDPTRYLQWAKEFIKYFSVRVSDLPGIKEYFLGKRKNIEEKNKRENKVKYLKEMFCKEIKEKDVKTKNETIQSAHKIDIEKSILSPDFNQNPVNKSPLSKEDIFVQSVIEKINNNFKKHNFFQKTGIKPNEAIGSAGRSEAVRLDGPRELISVGKPSESYNPNGYKRQKKDNPDNVDPNSGHGNLGLIELGQPINFNIFFD